MTTKREETWDVVPKPDGRYGANWREIHAGSRPVVKVGTFTRTAHGEQETHAGVIISEEDARRIAAVPDYERVLMEVRDALLAGTLDVEGATEVIERALRKGGVLP
jgi:hypothetical protein